MENNQPFEINGHIFRPVKSHAKASCYKCCFNSDDGCMMPVDVAGVVGSFCAEFDIIFKDETDVKDSRKET
jgi:hypothetical protein